MPRPGFKATGTNLFSNPGFTSGLTGWTTVSGTPQVIAYGTGGYPSTTQTEDPPGDANVIGNTSFVAWSIRQTVTLNYTLAAFNWLRFSFYVGFRSTWDDRIRVTFTFKNGSTTLSTYQFDTFYTSSNFSSLTPIMGYHERDIEIPAGTQTVEVLVAAVAGSWSLAYGFVDRLQLFTYRDGALVADGLIAAFPLDSPTALKDVSGNDVQLVDDGNTSLVTGKFGDALHPTTSAGRYRADVPEPAFNQQCLRVSVSAWANPDKSFTTMWGTKHVLAAKSSAVGDTYGWYLGVLPGGGNTIVFRVMDAATSPYTASYVETDFSGWKLYTGTFDGDFVRLYRNGVQVASTFVSGVLGHDPSYDIEIGEGWEGAIDEVCVWRRALYAEEVATLWNQGNGAQARPDRRPPFSVPDPFAGFLPYAYLPSDVPLGPNDPSIIAFNSIPIGVYPVSILDLLGLRFLSASVSLPVRATSLDPVPTVVSVTATATHLMTMVGSLRESDVEWDHTIYWEVEVIPGEAYMVLDKQEHLRLSNPQTVTDTFQIPQGYGFNGKRLRLVVVRERIIGISWASPWFNLSGDNFDHDPQPFVPPSPPAPIYVADPYAWGPGVLRRGTRDRS